MLVKLTPDGFLIISSTQESSWRCLECDVTEECQNFGGKIEIPAAMQYLLPKVEDSEVS